MKKLTLTETINKMEWHTKREVEGWREDLEIDKKELLEIDSKKPHTFIWVTRENGTFLINLNDDKGLEFLEAIRHTFSTGYKSYNEYLIQCNKGNFTFKQMEV